MPKIAPNSPASTHSSRNRSRVTRFVPVPDERSVQASTSRGNGPSDTCSHPSRACGFSESAVRETPHGPKKIEGALITKHAKAPKPCSPALLHSTVLHGGDHVLTHDCSENRQDRLTMSNLVVDVRQSVLSCEIYFADALRPFDEEIGRNHASRTGGNMKPRIRSQDVCAGLWLSLPLSGLNKECAAQVT